MDIQFDRQRIALGKGIYDELCWKLGIESDSVIVVFSGDDEQLDLIALNCLSKFVYRKKSRKAFLLCVDEKLKNKASLTAFDFPIKATKILRRDAISLYDYYCFAFNLDNIAFTFLNHCHYNLMGRILNETDITEEEAVCLGVYWLRELQEKKVNV